MNLQRNQIVEVTIDRLAYGGAGVGRHGGMAVFVHGAAPGDRVRARITKRRDRHAEAEIAEILTPSPLRQPSPCPLFGDCGGCKWLHLPYGAQAEAKRTIVEETFAHLGKIPHGPIEPMGHSPGLFRYRNKMDMTFGRDPQGQTIVGFHRAGRFDETIDVPVCLLQPESFDRLAGAVREWARRERLEPYDPRTHRGFLRSLILREGRNTGESLAVLITAEGDLPGRDRLVKALRAACGGLRGFVWGLNTGKADVAAIDRIAWVWGETNIRERLGDQIFSIAPMAFFQTNTAATEILYRLTAEALELTGHEVLLDAFCGTGTIGLHCAPRCRHVYGLELHTPAVLAARQNAVANGLANCTFLAGDVRETLRLIREVSAEGIDRVVVDPPRGGMHQRALQQLIAIGAPVFVYVSCNPTTLARDLQQLHESGYAIERAWPLDMFPHTYHVETVVKLRR